MKEKSITLNSAPKLTKAQRQRLEAIAKMPDEQIDTSDFPEMKLDHAIRFSRRPRTVTTHIEADLLAWLRSQDEDLDKALNRLLRLVMDLTRQLGRRRSAA
jgi:uncharacterized protein (DUF4415 family)